MSNLKLDKNTLSFFKKKNVSQIKIFFYTSGCSGTKLDITDDFEITNDLIRLDLDYDFDIYLEKDNVDKLDNCNITRIVKSDHTGLEKIRYIFSSNKVQNRCGCGSSFSFESKKIKIDFDKLKDMKFNFKK